MTQVFFMAFYKKRISDLEENLRPLLTYDCTHVRWMDYDCTYKNDSWKKSWLWFVKFELNQYCIS